VLSWGEIDPEFGNVPAMLGLHMDGRDLGERAPHLVVPGDRCGGDVSEVVEVRVSADDRLWARDRTESLTIRPGAHRP
jgi:hypothetical protein